MEQLRQTRDRGGEDDMDWQQATVRGLVSGAGALEEVPPRPGFGPATRT